MTDTKVIPMTEENIVEYAELIVEHYRYKIEDDNVGILIHANDKANYFATKALTEPMVEGKAMYNYDISKVWRMVAKIIEERYM